MMSSIDASAFTTARARRAWLAFSTHDEGRSIESYIDYRAVLSTLATITSARRETLTLLRAALLAGDATAIVRHARVLTGLSNADR